MTCTQTDLDREDAIRQISQFGNECYQPGV